MFIHVYTIDVSEIYFCSCKMSKTLSANHKFFVEMSPPVENEEQHYIEINLDFFFYITDVT